MIWLNVISVGLQDLQTKGMNFIFMDQWTLKYIRVRVYWDSYRSLFEVSHGFIPEFLVGCVLPDQLLLLLRQLEGLLYLHPFRGRLCRGWWLWWRRTQKKRLNKAAYTWIEKDGVCLRKIRRWWILEHLQAILKTKFHCSHCSHLSFSNNTLTCFELHL